MHTDLTYLAYTAMLTAALWIPHVVSQVMTHGPLKPANYRDPAPRLLPPWGKRAERTHMNAVEAFAPFAALVIAAHLLGKTSARVDFYVECFFWLRVVHALVYLAAIPYIRTLVFTLGFLAEVGIFWELVR
jgi:uncharacterized MAPEG superfamily protein